MSEGLIGILSVGPALAALELSGRLTMDRRITGLEARLDERMSGQRRGWTGEWPDPRGASSKQRGGSRIRTGVRRESKACW